MATAYQQRPTTRFRPWEEPAGGFPPKGQSAEKPREITPQAITNLLQVDISVILCHNSGRSGARMKLPCPPS